MAPDPKAGANETTRGGPAQGLPLFSLTFSARCGWARTRPPRGAHGPANETTTRPPANETRERDGIWGPRERGENGDIFGWRERGRRSPEEPANEPARTRGARERDGAANGPTRPLGAHGARCRLGATRRSAGRRPRERDAPANETGPGSDTAETVTFSARAAHDRQTPANETRERARANERERDALPDPAPGSAPRRPRGPPRPPEDPPRPPGAAGDDPPRPRPIYSTTTTPGKPRRPNMSGLCRYTPPAPAPRP